MGDRRSFPWPAGGGVGFTMGGTHDRPPRRPSRAREQHGPARNRVRYTGDRAHDCGLFRGVAYHRGGHGIRALRSGLCHARPSLWRGGAAGDYQAYSVRWFFQHRLLAAIGFSCNAFWLARHLFRLCGLPCDHIAPALSQRRAARDRTSARARSERGIRKYPVSVAGREHPLLLRAAGNRNYAERRHLDASLGSSAHHPSIARHRPCRRGLARGAGWPVSGRRSNDRAVHCASPPSDLDEDRSDPSGGDWRRSPCGHRCRCLQCRLSSTGQELGWS